MKNVAMIAYNFPPEGSAGTYRPLRFVRQLPNVGWIPTVISAIPSQNERYDPALLRMVPNEIEVIRIKAYDLWQAFQSSRSRRIPRHSSSAQEEPIGNRQNGQQSSFRTWLREIVRTTEACWYHPDMAMPWIDAAVEATVRRCQRGPIDVIWATAGPVSSFLVAQRSSVRTGIPYVLDFRDAWTITSTDFDRRRPGWAIRRDRQGMYRLLQGAQAVVFRHVTEAECFWRAYPEALEAQKIHLIPNGFEGPIEAFIPPVEGKCTILYTGTVFSYRFSALFDAVTFLKHTEPALVKHLCLRFVGEGSQLLGREAVTRGISEIVEVRDPVRQSELPSLYSQSHALLVLGREPVIKGFELLVGAKLFEYLKTGRPIIGVLPYDQTRLELENIGVKTIADADSAHQIAQLIRHVMDQWSNGNLDALLPDRKACEAYSSERQTVALVRALEGLPAEVAFVPGIHEIPPTLRDTIGPNGWLDN